MYIAHKPLNEWNQHCHSLMAIYVVVLLVRLTLGCTAEVSFVCVCVCVCVCMYVCVFFVCVCVWCVVCVCLYVCMCVCCVYVCVCVVCMCVGGGGVMVNFPDVILKMADIWQVTALSNFLHVQNKQIHDKITPKKTFYKEDSHAR